MLHAKLSVYTQVGINLDKLQLHHVCISANEQADRQCENCNLHSFEYKAYPTEQYTFPYVFLMNQGVKDEVPLLFCLYILDNLAAQATMTDV